MQTKEQINRGGLGTRLQFTSLGNACTDGVSKKCPSLARNALYPSMSKSMLHNNSVQEVSRLCTIQIRAKSYACTDGKRILKLPKWASNSVVNVMMGWPTMKARILVRKLGFLLRLVSADGHAWMTWNHYAWSGNVENLRKFFRHTTLTKCLGVETSECE